MRGMYKLTMVAAVLLVGVGLVVGQPGGGQGGKGGKGGFGKGGFGKGGFTGGFGGKTSSDPLSLIRSKQVRDELKLTDEQVEQIPEAVQKALKDVLNAKQYTRLQQIQLQLKGNNALRDAEIQAKLGLSKEQKEDIALLDADYKKATKELFGSFGKGGKGGKGGFNTDNFKKIRALREELEKNIKSVLNESQQKQWRDMTGPEFKMQQFGGFGGKGGFGKGGKDGGATKKRPDA